MTPLVWWRHNLENSTFVIYHRYMFIIKAKGGKVTPLACLLTNKVNNAEELTYLSTDNIVFVKNATESNTWFTWLGFLGRWDKK